MNNIRNRFAKTLDAANQLIDRFNSKHVLATDMQLSKKERTAVVNLAFHTAPSFVDRLTAYLQKRALKSSAISLDGLQSEALKLGWTPKAVKGSAKWKEILKTTETSLLVATDRWIKDYEDMPMVLRKRLGEDSVTNLITMCNLLTWALSKCQQDLVAEEFSKLEEALMSQYEAGLLDEQLTDAIEAKSEAFNWDHLPVMKQLFEKTCKETRTALERREQEAADKVMLATFDDIIAQAEGDQVRFIKYMAKKSERDGDLVSARASYQRRLRERGHGAVDKFLECYCKAMTHLNKTKDKDALKDAKARPSKYAAVVTDFINKARSATNIRAENTYIIHVLDYVVFQGIDATCFQDAVATSSQMNLNLAGRAATLVTLPAVFGECSYQSAIKHTRLIEDMLMKHSNDLSIRCSFTYNEEDSLADERLC